MCETYEIRQASGCAICIIQSHLTNPCTGPRINYHVTTPCSLAALSPPRLCATAVNSGPVTSALAAALRIYIMNRIILFPGMGATDEMYERCDFNKNIELVNWIPADRWMSLRSYAKVIARYYDITKNDWVGGSSFGGMIAASLMGIVGCRKLILIGSCTSPRHIHPFLLKSAALGSVLPFSIGLSVSKFHSMPLMSRMAYGQGSFMNWACGALRGWPGEHVNPNKIAHIHGDRDFVIPINRVSPNQIEKDCGHLLAIQRPKQLSDFINNL